MDSVIDLEAQQAAESMSLAGAFSPLSHHRRSGNGPQGVEGAERHEMDSLGPHTAVLQVHSGRCLLAVISMTRHGQLPHRLKV